MTTSPRSRLAALALLAAAPLTACAGVGGEGSASCVAVLEVDGRSYYGGEEPEGRVPTTGERVDAVLPGCNDTGGAGAEREPDEQVRAAVIEDVPTTTAVFLGGLVYVREGERLPAAAAPWSDVVRCAGPGEQRVVGRWLSVSEPARPSFDGVLDPPYDVVVRVSAGPAPWRGENVVVQVTGATEPVLARGDLDALGSARLAARVVCDDGALVARSVVRR